MGGSSDYVAPSGEPMVVEKVSGGVEQTGFVLKNTSSTWKGAIYGPAIENGVGPTNEYQFRAKILKKTSGSSGDFFFGLCKDGDFKDDSFYMKSNTI
jgi:hypothetical protein